MRSIWRPGGPATAARHGSHRPGGRGTRVPDTARVRLPGRQRGRRSYRGGQPGGLQQMAAAAAGIARLPRPGPRRIHVRAAAAWTGAAGAGGRPDGGTSGRRAGVRAGRGRGGGAVRIVDGLLLPDGRVAKEAGDVPRWFQFYWPADWAVAESLVNRAAASGYTALVVTVDTPAFGYRPADLDHRYLPFLQHAGIANFTIPRSRPASAGTSARGRQ